ncbi:MAG: hypothetical protein WCO07_02835 [bacterium]
MLKIFTRVGLVMLIILFSFEIVNAYSGASQLFAGRIINTKATEIQSLESANYKCNVPGSSITIRSYKGPTSYVIPSGTTAKTGTVASGNLIMGKYTSSASTVTCIYQGYPPTTQTVTLSKITLFGASGGGR